MVLCFAGNSEVYMYEYVCEHVYVLTQSPL